MCSWLAQRSEGCEFESHPGPNSVVSQISQSIEISRCIIHSESLCDCDYPPDPLDQKLLDKMAQWLAQNPEGCEFESNT